MEQSRRAQSRLVWGMHTHLCVYVSMYVSVCLCVGLCLRICVNVYVRISISMCTKDVNNLFKLKSAKFASAQKLLQLPQTSCAI